jgi:PKHD-type hydroxylase
VHALIAALRADPLFRLGVQPKAFSLPRLQHHRPDHPGAPTTPPAFVAGAAGPIRADVSVCVFLCEPDDYAGGELIIDAGFGDTPFKERLGTCLAFPAGSSQRVAPVVAGDRWTATVHVQSLIRGAAERQVVYDVGCAAFFLETFGQAGSDEAALLSRCREQLLRTWTEP